MYKSIGKLLNQAFECFLRFPCVRSTDRLLLSVIVLLLTVALSTYGVSGGSQTGDGAWSLSFRDLTVAEALKELTRVTGVNLYANRPPEDRRLTRTYENQTIEEIIRDVFRGNNHSLVWNYGEKGLESIGIWFYDEDKSPKSSGGGVNRTLGWSVERDRDYYAPQEVPRIDPRQLARRRPPGANRGVMNRRGTEASETDDEETEGEDKYETAQDNEDETDPPESDLDESSENQEEPEDDSSGDEEEVEDESSEPGDGDEEESPSGQLEEPEQP
jgi:hypothetical protein